MMLQIPQVATGLHEIARSALTDGVVASEAESEQGHLHALHEVVSAQRGGEVLLHGVGAACTRNEAVKQ